MSIYTSVRCPVCGSPAIASVFGVTTCPNCGSGIHK